VIKRFSWLFCILLLCALALSGCNLTQDRSPKPSPDWSRGLRLGQSNLRQPVAIQVDQNRHVHLVWCDAGALQYAHLDEQAHLLANIPLPLDLPSPRQPQLLVDAENRLHLAWLSRDGSQRRLYHTTLDAKGQPGELWVSADDAVASFDLYLSPHGEVSLVWAGTQGLVHARLQDPSPPTLLDPQGIDPFILVDAAGTTHLAWLQAKGNSSRALYYATLQDGGTPAGLQLSPQGGQKLAEFSFPDHGVYDGPIIGTDKRQVYLLWSVQNLGGGLTPSAAMVYYVAFPHGAPQVLSPQSMALPSETRPIYADYADAYGLSKLALLSPEDTLYGSDFVNTPAAATASQDDLPVALSLKTESQSESTIQLAMAILADGRQVGYQLASKTGTASLLPSIATDANGSMHLAWIDTAGFNQYQVYYASNAPQAREWLDRTSSNDVILGAADLAFGVLSGIGLLPIAGIWSLPGLVWVVLFFIVSGQEELERTPAKIGFAAAIAIYVGMKLLLLPGLFIGTPFLQRIPPAWATAAGIAIPAFLLALALGATYLYSKRAERATIFQAYLIFALTDVLLTLVLYSPGFFAT
jgi:hypothetical protein